MKELINANDKYKMNWIEALEKELRLLSEEDPNGVRLNALKAFP